jgi:hypothetical protein
VTDDGDWRTTFRPDIPSAARIYDYLLGGKDGGHDRLVQRGQQHRHHQSGVNNQQPARLRGLLSLPRLTGHPDVSVQRKRTTNA